MAQGIDDFYFFRDDGMLERMQRPTPCADGSSQFIASCPSDMSKRDVVKLLRHLADEIELRASLS